MWRDNDLIDPATSVVAADRLADIHFVLDELERWNAVDPLFRGQLNLEFDSPTSSVLLRRAQLLDLCAVSFFRRFLRDDAEPPGWPEVDGFLRKE